MSTPTAAPTVVLLGMLAGAALAAEPCAQWTALDTPVPPEAGDYAPLRDVEVLAPDDAWAVGHYRDDYPPPQGPIQMPYALRWDGTQWNPVPVPSPQACPTCDGPSLNAIDAAGPNDIWAAGAQQYTPPQGFFGVHTFVMHWDGTSWEEVPTPHLGGGSGDSIADIEVIGPNEVWFVGTDQPAPSAPDLALTWRWDGTRFERFFVPLVATGSHRYDMNGLGAVDAFAPDDVWTVGGTSVNAQGNEDHSQIHRWDGTEWKHVPGPTPGFWNSLGAVEAVAEDDVWAAGRYMGTDGIEPFLIRWNGTEWIQQDAPAYFRDFYAVAPDDVYAFADGVYHFDGVEWSLVADFPGATRPVLAAGDGSGGCDIFAVGQQNTADYDIINFSVRSLGSGAPDLNGDGETDLFDLLVMIDHLGACQSAHCPSDLNGDGTVDLFDVLALLDALA